MSVIDRRFRLADDADGLGLSCTLEGVSLAGAPLLRITAAGLAPRAADEIDVLIKGAYGPDVDPTALTRGLQVIAEALNRGDLGRAMVAAVQLRLPEPTWDGAVRIARAHDGLTKQYNPDEPRDWHGRWTTAGGAGADCSSATNPRPSRVPDPSSRPAHLYGGVLIPVADEPEPGIGDNGPPPDAELIPPNEPDFPTSHVPEGWDRPGQVVDGLYYPPFRNPTLPDGSSWPRVTPDIVQAALAPQGGRKTPSMVVYVPQDGIGPMLVGSTATFEYEEPEGYDSVILKGTPQITRTLDGQTDHDLAGIREALRLAETNQFSQISFNQTFTTSTEGAVVSNIRPDVFAIVRPDIELPYRYYPWETLSPGQNLRVRQNQMPAHPSVAPVEGRSYKRARRLSPERLAELGVRYLCS